MLSYGNRCPSCKKLVEVNSDELPPSECPECDTPLFWPSSDSGPIDAHDEKAIETILNGGRDADLFGFLQSRLADLNRLGLVDIAIMGQKGAAIVESRYRCACEPCTRHIGKFIPCEPGSFARLPPFTDCSSPYRCCLAIEPAYDGDDIYLDCLPFVSDESGIIAIFEGVQDVDLFDRIAERLNEFNKRCLKQGAIENVGSLMIVPSGYPCLCDVCALKIGQSIKIGPGANDLLPPFPDCISPFGVCLVAADIGVGVSELRQTHWCKRLRKHRREERKEKIQNAHAGTTQTTQNVPVKENAPPVAKSPPPSYTPELPIAYPVREPDPLIPDPDAFGLKQWLTMCGWIVLGIACYFSYCR